MLNQLSEARFPVLLTHKYACDQSVVDLLRSRTLGNSPTLTSSLPVSDTRKVLHR